MPEAVVLRVGVKGPTGVLEGSFKKWNHLFSHFHPYEHNDYICHAFNTLYIIKPKS